MDSGAMESLAHCLQASIGLRWLPALQEQGANTIVGVTYLLEEDLRDIGMTTVEIRRFCGAVQTHVAWTWNPGSTAFIGPPLQRLSMATEAPQPSREEMATLQNKLTLVEQEAIEALNIIGSANETPEVATCADTAKALLSNVSGTTRLAMSAENAIARALSEGPTNESRRLFQEAERRTRDVIVLRNQIGVPLVTPQLHPCIGGGLQWRIAGQCVGQIHARPWQGGVPTFHPHFRLGPPPGECCSPARTTWTTAPRSSTC